MLPPELRECRADVATLIFVLSAISPPKMSDAIRAIRSGLRDGGLVLLRDYAIGDGAQIRLQRASAPKQLAADSAYFVRQVRCDAHRANEPEEDSDREIAHVARRTGPDRTTSPPTS